MKQLIILFLLATLSFPGVGQDQQYRAQRADFALYNMGMGGLAGGVGAWVNKKKDQKWHRIFFKGMAQGTIGRIPHAPGQEPDVPDLRPRAVCVRLARAPRPRRRGLYCAERRQQPELLGALAYQPLAIPTGLRPAGTSLSDQGVSFGY